MLIDYFMAEINCEFRKIHKNSWDDRKLSVNARNVLLQHSWPGNIRELRNTLSRIMLWAPNVTIKAKEVSDAMFADSPNAEENKSAISPSLAFKKKDFNLQDFLGTIAVEYIEKALEQTDQNKSKAAKLLGFANYQTLDNWVDKYRD